MLETLPAEGVRAVVQPRRLLILTYHFPPSAASGTFRLLGFARHLPAFGWQMTVVAPPQLPWEPVDHALTAQVPAETTLHLVPYPRRAPRALRWLAPWGIWLPAGLVAALRAAREQPPDAVLTSGPPHFIHLLGLFLQRRLRLPWVADFRDPWTTDLEGNRLTLRMRWERFWERQVLSRADVILANAPRATASFQEAYPRQAHKMVTLTNGYDPERFDLCSPAVSPTGTVRIMHAGQLYAGRDPRPLLDALRALGPAVANPGRPFHIEFLGRTFWKTFDLETEVRRRGLEALVSSGGQVSYDQALREMARADLLLLLDSPGRRGGVPAKLYEYLGAGRPILALAEADGDVASVLRDSGVAHRIAPPTDSAAIGRALLDLVEAVSRGLEPASAEQRTRYSREHLTGCLARILDEHIRPARPAQRVGSGRESVAAGAGG